jgi:glycosyltransferase involved in cell wall biosynthesis
VTRLAIIGPLPPFRSGIAQHTMMLAGALAPVSDLQIVSFTRQYPAWLFPGESDRSTAEPLPAGLDCRYLLDSLNPLTWRRTVRTVAARRPDAVIIPWWTVYWAPCFSYLATALARRDVPVCFFCHNVLEHEASWWRRSLTRRVLRLGSGFIVQSEAERERLQSMIPGASVAAHPHPVFEQFPPPTRTLPRRAALELLFFGIVRPYKGLDVLLRAIAMLRDRDVMLTVAGEFWSRLGATTQLIDELGIAGMVDLVPRYVSQAEAASFFTRADAVVLPYLSATGSGVLGLAYRYGKPVVASRVAGIAELVTEGQTGMLVPAGSARDLANALSGLSSERAREMLPAIQGRCRGLSWDSLARTVLEQVVPEAQR